MLYFIYYEDAATGATMARQFVFNPADLVDSRYYPGTHQLVGPVELQSKAFQTITSYLSSSFRISINSQNHRFKNKQ